ncbi:MAG: hypothetical protein NC331_11330 [Lachnospiraceae bacterium]|nr:hypothetical protein [Lachnospiraceae bacterium]MCM1239959.1 hypothetical protein [Lachnospiraceae bacterium]
MMARLEIDLPEDLLSELLSADFGEIAAEALSEAAPILEQSLKTSCRRAIDHEGESEMVDSITCGKPKKTKTDAWILNVGPRGYSRKKYYRGSHGRRYPVSNALKMIWKEYGIAGRQAPRPFITNARNNARGAVIRKMQEVYERKVGAR